MAVGVDVIKTTGRLIFTLQRDDETTTRAIDVPFPKTNAENLQTAVNEANARFTNSNLSQNLVIQPATWRDNNDAEAQWTTTGVSYEIVTTTTTPITPETPVTVGSAQEHQQEEYQGQ